MPIKNKYFINEILVHNESLYDDEMELSYTKLRGPFMVVQDFLLIEKMKEFYDSEEDEKKDGFLMFLVDNGYLTILNVHEIDINYISDFNNKSLNYSVSRACKHCYEGDDSSNLHRYVLIPKHNIQSVLDNGIIASIDNPIKLYITQGTYYTDEMDKIIKISTYEMVKVKIILPKETLLIFSDAEYLVGNIPKENIIQE